MKGNTESIIAVIGVVTLVGWFIYSRNKEKAERLRAGNTAAPETAANPVPRRAFQERFKIVMPSDLVAPNVRQRAQELTERRFSVDTTKLV